MNGHQWKSAPSLFDYSPPMQFGVGYVIIIALQGGIFFAKL